MAARLGIAAILGDLVGLTVVNPFVQIPWRGAIFSNRILRMTIQLNPVTVVASFLLVSVEAPAELTPASATDLEATCQLMTPGWPYVNSRHKAWYSGSKYDALSKVSSSLTWSRLPDEISCGGKRLKLRNENFGVSLDGIGHSADGRYLAFDGYYAGGGGYVFGGKCVFMWKRRGWHLLGCTDTFIS
jgi:hypothetical protein